MPDPYQQSIQRHIDIILKSGGKAANQLVKDFIHYYYQNVSLSILEHADPKLRFTQALSSYKFFHKAAPKRKIRIFNPTLKNDGWESDRTVIEIVGPDMPFLLDSVTAELNQQGYRIYTVIHPIVAAKRNSSGVVEKIYPEVEDKRASHVDSLIHIQIIHLSEERARKKLERDLMQVLDLVHFAVQDWKDMTLKMRQVSTRLEEMMPHLDADAIKRIREFITWIEDDHYIFLGARDYKVVTKPVGKNGHKVLQKSYEVIESSELGIFSSPHFKKEILGLEALSPSAILADKAAGEPLQVTKSTRKSKVHRPVHMDYLGFKHYDKQGNVVRETRFLGLFTSSVYYQSAKEIPLVREKINEVFSRADFVRRSHNAKALMAVLDNFPRDELFQISVDELLKFCLGIIDLEKCPRVRVFVRPDAYKRFVSALIFVPRERFNTLARLRIQKILEQAYHGTVTDHYTQITDSPIARLHLIIRMDSGEIAKVNIPAIDRKIEEVTSSWVEGLQECIIDRLGERAGAQMFHRYRDGFPESFKSRYHFSGTYRDIEKMEAVIDRDPTDPEIALDLYQLQEDNQLAYQLKLYHPTRQIMLSEILPMLEHMGFSVVDGMTFLVKPLHYKEGVHLHHFRLQLAPIEGVKAEETPRCPLTQIKEEFERVLYLLWSRQLENDALNSLVLRAGMLSRDIEILRAYVKYLRQTGFAFSHDYLARALARYPAIAKMLAQLFHVLFDPKFETKGDVKAARQKKSETVIAQIEALLSEVKSAADDRIIRRLMDTMRATLRTNFFQKGADGFSKSYISLKFNSQAVPDLPLPRPFREIFVYDYRVEGIHLRGGKVARGGLRWSDRPDDFRTEILGLMKAQQVKNTVIVPVGSKGGFVVKRPPKESDAFQQEGIHCYKTFLRGLLDVTDNLVQGKVVPPKDVVRYDEDDPYLVVAADKGTATFSDTANGVSAEYGFWLGDAFASGGSAGYDHKKMAITAKGAWISVTRHFAEMGRSMNEPFTVIGIGGMSGDVFGNGMLLSDKIKLVAAFNHQHVFLDPNPDPAKSFVERKRLFGMPRAGWADYKAELISKGGGIFERSAKSVSLSPEIKKMLGVRADNMTPDALIRAVLTMDADLLWNGGIGTFVKASDESHEAVGDRANDTIRVNADELKVRVVGEGGNLGFTQFARIEYGKNGGRINTDAIDNSAGVDCSDHEVNIKIAFTPVLQRKALTIVKRNQLLVAMQDEVEHLVLRDNILQTQAITVAHQQGYAGLEPMQRLTHKLEKEGKLNRAVEFLPDEEGFVQLHMQKVGLTRAEIAVLLAYAKLDIYERILATDLPDNVFYNKDLLLYFPKEMQKKFASDIARHALRREIVATSLTNAIVNRMGPTFAHMMADETGNAVADIVRAYTIARESFGLDGLWEDIEAMSGKIPAAAQLALFNEVGALAERSTLWFLSHLQQPIDVARAVEDFRPGIIELASYLHHVMGEMAKKTYELKFEHFQKIGVPDVMAKKFASLEALSSACEILYVLRHQTGKKTLSLRVIAEVYYQLGTRFGFSSLRQSARQLTADNYWKRMAQKTLIHGFYDQQMRLTAEVIKLGCDSKSCGEAITRWIETYAKDVQRYDAFINDLRANEYIDAAMLQVSSRRVEELFPV